MESIVLEACGASTTSSPPQMVLGPCAGPPPPPPPPPPPAAASMLTLGGPVYCRWWQHTVTVTRRWKQRLAAEVLQSKMVVVRLGLVCVLLGKIWRHLAAGQAVGAGLESEGMSGSHHGDIKEEEQEDTLLSSC